MLKAHGFTPRWKDAALTPQSCEDCAGVDLHFHDLWREFASWLLEAPGVARHKVRDWIGHANISTTSRYLSTTAVHLQNTLKEFEKARDLRTSFAQTESLANPVGSDDQKESPDSLEKGGRGAEIRTRDFLLPKQARYRAAPRPDIGGRDARKST